MQHGEFRIGETFWCGGRQWRCTDIGTRSIVAIRIDEAEVSGTNPALCRTLNRGEAESEGWFNGPSYAVAETVFDEYDLPACSSQPNVG
jgi:hypothetical protein